MARSDSEPRFRDFEPNSPGWTNRVVYCDRAPGDSDCDCCGTSIRKIVPASIKKLPQRAKPLANYLVTSVLYAPFSEGVSIGKFTPASVVAVSFDTEDREIITRKSRPDDVVLCGQVAAHALCYFFAEQPFGDLGAFSARMRGKEYIVDPLGLVGDREVQAVWREILHLDDFVNFERDTSGLPYLD